jgi:hypothetical protein
MIIKIDKSSPFAVISKVIIFYYISHFCEGGKLYSAIFIFPLNGSSVGAEFATMPPTLKQINTENEATIAAEDE